MRVGVIADTHDRVPAVAEFAKRFRAAGANLVLHAGDYCAPWSLRPFVDSGLSLAGVFGRNDGDLEGMRARDLRAFSVQYHPEAGPGPHDARYLFAEFTDLMRAG